ncbi:MAG: hypothetical protein WBS20_14310 [Lysobacterales bacterium]
MTKQTFMYMAAVLAISVLPATASADDFDGSKPLTCASIFSAECNAASQECITGAPWMINFPVFIEIDFKAKKASTTKLHENTRVSPISQVSTLKSGHTAIQGIDNDFIWSMVIAQETGSMTLSISGEDTGYIVFGACHPN